MCKTLYTILVSTLLLTLVSCGVDSLSKGGKSSQSAETETETKAEEAEVEKYSPPMPPPIITSQAEQIRYVANHYWDNFNFRDTTLLSNSVAEIAFADMIPILEVLPREDRKVSIGMMLERASVDSVALRYILDRGEHYLYNPNSPTLNEELYIPILEWMVEASALDEDEKILPRYRLDMAMRNRLGSVAADISLKMHDGQIKDLHDLDSPLLILFFGNPGCPECERLEAKIVSNRALFDNDFIKVVAIYIEQDEAKWMEKSYPDWWLSGYDYKGDITQNQTYDIRAIPTLYLLGNDRRVLLKDTSVEILMEGLSRVANTSRR